MRVTFALLLVTAGTALAAPPELLDPRLTLELVAAQPDIVTPTGIAVDAKGRIWCIENHTHQTATGYQGPKTDRIRVFDDFDAAGKARRVSTFADGFRDAMGLTFSIDGALYLATRAALYRFDGNQPRVIVRLETKGNYPHNGLCGFEWDANGDLIFGLGENLGESYKVIGSDGSALSGGGEGGSIYRCRPDGANVARVATGFWNPFAQCLDRHGHLFAVDNDPDARGPNRLLHVIQGGDFGYRFRYGRKGTHPFQCWNGEHPGTLPMVAGTSEAPSGVIASDFTSMPDDYDGELLVTSWGDHTIERFRLQPRGASFSATSRTIVRGDEDFRPVAFAIAPDGSVVFSDWVKKEYPVHGHGRIWRLSAKPASRGTATTRSKAPVSRTEKTWADIAKQAKAADERAHALSQLRSQNYLAKFVPLLGDSDPFVVCAMVEALGRPEHVQWLNQLATTATNQPQRLGLLLALRRTGSPLAHAAMSRFLQDGDPAVRRAAIQWVAEERLTAYANQLQAAAQKLPVTRELFESWLAAQELLDGRKPKDPGKYTVAESYVIDVLRDRRQPVLFRTVALRMVRPDHPAVTAQFLADCFSETDADLRIEVLRTLIARTDAGSQSLLRKFAVDDTLPLRLRALAITGLSYSADAAATMAVLEQTRKHPQLQEASARSLATDPPAGSNFSTDRWRQLLAGDGDADAGERVFFHPKGPGCYKCHRIDGRGAAIGPDLSLVGRMLSRERLIDSILEPSKEIAPAFTTWRITTHDGKERVGMIVGESHDSMFHVADALGVITKLSRTLVDERTALKISIMPQELANRMSVPDFRNVLAYLMARK